MRSAPPPKRESPSARDDLAGFAAEGPVVLWGAGSKGMTYLNVVSDVAPIVGVVDINPRKAGWGVPGTDLVIVGPDALVEVQPRTVLVANPVYVEEISAQLRELDVDADASSPVGLIGRQARRVAGSNSIDTEGISQASGRPRLTRSCGSLPSG